MLGVGYRPRTGAVFFTRNGKKLDDAYIGLTKHNLFPTVAADGAASIHVNLGQAGFVFIEANVKKWGLAPMIGTLAPPPAYGSERGSILLETAIGPQAIASQPTSSLQNSHHRHRSNEAAAVAALAPPESHDAGSSRLRTPSHRRVPSGSTVPIRPSPLRTSMTRQRTSSYTGSSASAASSPMSIPGTSPPYERDVHEGGQQEDDALLPHNPPTPGQLDISLRAMSPFSRRREMEDREEQRRHSQTAETSSPPSSSSTSLSTSTYRASSPPTSTTPSYHVSVATQAPVIRTSGDISPPSYQLIDSNQYPAGVAEAMLEAMPEEQFAALFAAAASVNSTAGPHGSSPGGSGSGSLLARSYENRMSGIGAESTSESLSQAQQGLGLRGIFGNVWRRSNSDQGQSTQSQPDSLV